MRLLDLFCGRWGWSRAFAARSWTCEGVDLVSSPLPAADARFTCADILDLTPEIVKRFEPDFIVASPPCEQFSIHNLKMWFPNPAYPELGIKLFNHTRALCESSGIPYVIENVKAAQQFVGDAVHHCGPFYLWGNGVPPLMHQGIGKGSMLWSSRYRNMGKKQRKAEVATIPPELANCVAAYAERILDASRGADRTDSRA
jgi:hypothetical protein